MSDTSVTKDLEVGYLSSALGGNAAALAVVQQTRQRVFSVLISDAATAGTAVTETNILAGLPYAVKVISCTVAAPIAVTASDTLFATFSVAKRTAAGATSTAIASQTTKTSGSGGLGSLVAFATNTLTLSATTSDLALAAGSVLTVAVAKASTGTALTAATSYVCVTVIVEDI